MTIDTGLAAQAASTGGSDAQVDRLLRRAKAGATANAAPSPVGDARMVKAGKDFESILLGNWLQQAEQSFAKVPGGDGDDDDSGKDQFGGIAMQALAGSLTASGGIGIAKMITGYLQKRQQSAEATQTAKAPGGAAAGPM